MRVCNDSIGCHLLWSCIPKPDSHTVVVLWSRRVVSIILSNCLLPPILCHRARVDSTRHKLLLSPWSWVFVGVADMASGTPQLWATRISLRSTHRIQGCRFWVIKRFRIVSFAVSKLVIGSLRPVLPSCSGSRRISHLRRGFLLVPPYMNALKILRSLFLSPGLSALTLARCANFAWRREFATIVRP